MKHVKLSLREKDYGLPLGKTIDAVASYPYYYHRERKENHQYDYRATYEKVDSDRLRIRRGDIIRFSSCKWTFRKEVRGKYGVIIERYRIIKYKISGTFKDYYAVVLVTSGKLKGQLYNVSCHRLSSLNKQI